MDALKQMSLPDKLSEWNCVIQVEIQGEANTCHQWILADGEMSVEEGATHPPDFFIRTDRIGLLAEGKADLLDTKGNMVYGVGNKKAINGARLRMHIANYLKENHPDLLARTEQVNQADLQRGLEEKAAEYQTLDQSVNRMLSYFIRVLPGLAGFILIVYLMQGLDKVFWISLPIAFSLAIVFVSIREMVNYRRYHRE